MAIAAALAPALGAGKPPRGASAFPAPPPAPRAGDATARPALDEVAIKGLAARPIGPALMGGRVSDIALDPVDPFTFYVALGTGGILKTVNNGVTWAGVFEKQPVAAVGALAVSPSDPKVVWAGTGEANDRNSSSWGNGVYRSIDAGATWTHAGLDASRTIARIAVHPKDSNIAWVAAMGDLWNPGTGRGLYKTVDGGKNWSLVLQAPAPFADRVGCGEVALDPQNPDVLYAALYARRRTPWSFEAGPDATEGKDLGGLFKSGDGGATWTKLEGGLPKRTGRIGLSVHAKDPKILYAVVQSLEGNDGNRGLKSLAGGVFRSGDAGATWERVNDLNPRPFYFSQIRVDPTDDKKVYLLGFMLHASEDGGRTFREDRFVKVHPDCHALAIDPRSPARLLLGTDGGVYQSFERGANWQHLNNAAAGEFYRISLDDSTPYRICGGLQDNTNWVGPNRKYSKDGLMNADWTNIGGGDGFSCVFDGDDPATIYAESQQGYLHRFNLANGELKEMRPAPAEGQKDFRFHWNAPLIGSRHAKDTLYLAGNRVFRLTHRGEDWTPISPDLSARDPEKMFTAGSGAENYGVVYTLAESPLKAGLLWAGTDDGKLWRTDDDGGAWTDLTGSLPPGAKGQWMTRLEASHFDAGRAFLAVDAHRSGVFAPLVFRTDDGGRTWRSIAGDLPGDHPVKVIREDPVNRDLLFAGTEFAAFASTDGGAHWAKISGVPTVAVDDLAIHARDRDLVIATHGRSLYVLDDISALEALDADSAAKDAFLFPPRPAFGTNPLPGWADWTGAADFRGANPPDGALLSVWVRAYTGEDAKLAVTDAAGRPVANLTVPGKPGLQRVSWDLKPTKDLLNEYGGEGAKFVKPGDYTVKMTFGKVENSQRLQVAVAEGLETR